MVEVCPKESWYEGFAESSLHVSRIVVQRGRSRQLDWLWRRWMGRMGEKRQLSEGEELWRRNVESILKKSFSASYNVMLSLSPFKALSG